MRAAEIQSFNILKHVTYLFVNYLICDLKIQLPMPVCILNALNMFSELLAFLIIDYIVLFFPGMFIHY